MSIIYVKQSIKINLQRHPSHYVVKKTASLPLMVAIKVLISQLTIATMIYHADISQYVIILCSLLIRTTASPRTINLRLYIKEGMCLGWFKYEGIDPIAVYLDYIESSRWYNVDHNVAKMVLYVCEMWFCTFIMKSHLFCHGQQNRLVFIFF